MDYFKILGVAPTANTEEIKQAYRQKARQFHPDLNPDPAAVERFHLISEAYNTLADDEKRSLYVATRMKTAANPAPLGRKPRYRRYPNSTHTFHIALLIMGAAILGTVLDRFWYEVVDPMQDAQAVTCHAETLQSLGEGFYRLYYYAVLPDGELFYNNTVLDQPVLNYLPGSSFACYYNPTYQTTHLFRYDADMLWSLIPWSLFALVLLGKAGHHFFARVL